MVLQNLAVLYSIIQSSKKPNLCYTVHPLEIGGLFLEKVLGSLQCGLSKRQKNQTPPPTKKKSIHESSLFKGWVPKQQILSCEEAIMLNYYWYLQGVHAIKKLKSKSLWSPFYSLQGPTTTWAVYIKKQQLFIV